MSDSVSKALQLRGGTAAKGTATFVEMFNKFFDVMNVSNFTDGKRTRNTFKDPYRSVKDVRIVVSITFCID